MSSSTPSPLPIKNQLLASLPTDEYQRLVPHLELVSLQSGQILCHQGEVLKYAYFPHHTIISLVCMMQNGSTVEVGLVGNDGILGVPIFLADSISIYEANVQIPSSAVRIRADVLKSEFNRGGALQSVLLRYSQALLNQVSQGAACNRLHTLEERLARWLLTVRDRLESDELPLTQEFMSQMLGTRRSGVTVAAITLQQAGTIRYARGKITILNREGLEATSCECYGAVKGEFKRLLGTRYV